MNPNTSFTPEELVPFMLVFATTMVVLVRNYLGTYENIWSPLAIVCVIFSYYCVLGPYQAVESGDTYDRLKNMRPHYVSALWGAFAALASFVIGYHLHGKPRTFTIAPDISSDKLFLYGRNTFLAGFILFTISTGGAVSKLINPLDAEYVQQVGGSFGNYLGLSLNFVIPGITFLFLYYLLTKKRFLWFIIPFAISSGIFITLGFRYRLVLLLGSLVISYFFVNRRKPNPIISIASIVGFIILMGVINMSRNYGAGLDLSKLEKKKEGYYTSGLRESLIFQTSGAVIDIVPEKHPHAGFEPIVSTVLFPLPSALFSEKNSAKYLFDTLDAIYGKRLSGGAAIMAYGEYYLAFGWLGIIGGFFLMGWLFRKLWNWFLFNSQNYLAIAVYSVTVSYLYVIISRGYLPQVTMLFFFTVFPAYVILRLAKRHSKFLTTGFQTRT